MPEPTTLEPETNAKGGSRAEPTRARQSSRRRHAARAWRAAQIGLALSAGVAGFALWAHRTEAGTPAARVVQYRQALYASIDWNIEQMRAALDDPAGYDRARFAAAAARVAQLAPMLAEGFPPGSDRPARSAARPAVWEQSDVFHRQQAQFQASSSALASLAAHAGPAAVRPAFAELRQQCTRCHDNYLRSP